MINAKQILEVLGSNRFERFATDGGMLDRYIRGDITQPSEEDMIGEINRIFCLPDSVNSDIIPA
jgi:hypothetical protein